MDKESSVVTGGSAAVGTIMSFFTGMLTPLFFMLIVFEVLEYLSGMISAWRVEGWSSEVALKGALKKFGYFFLVAVGFGFDYLLHDFVSITGLQLNVPSMFGVLIMWYLLSTELISIVENMSEIGIDIPFIAPALKSFREKVKKLSEKKKDDEK